MAVMFQYDRFIKLFGILRLGGLENPKAKPISRLTLPRGSTLHYMPQTETELGPDKDNPLLNIGQRLTYIDHVADLLVKEGNPRPTYKLIAPMQQQYRRENMLIRPMRDYDAASKEPLNLVVINYAMVGQMYKYMRSALSRWWYWKNIRSTMWERINQLKTDNERRHVVVFDVPQSLPSLSDLRKAERGMTPLLMNKVFTSRERLDLLDIWTWLGENRKSTPMARLDESRLNEVILLIRRDTGWLTINLGLLNGWRKADAGVSMESFKAPEAEENFDFDALYDEYVSLENAGDCTPVDGLFEASLESPQGLDPKIIQVRFLKLLTKVVDQTSAVVDTSDDAQELEAERSEEEAREEAEAEERILQESGNALELAREEEEELSAELDTPVTDSDAIMMDEDGELIIESSPDERVDVPAAVGTSNIEHTLTSTIHAKLDELVEKDLYTAAQYRRMQRLAESYKTIPNPWDSSKTIEESLDIPNDDLVLGEADTYPKTDAVRDESMLQSTVEKMDSQYIEKVMNKDILNAVMSVQKAGIAVTGYTVETMQDAVSHYEVHKIQLTPVTGKPSTISFRVPVVDKRGVYTSNGQRYRMRTQKADK